MLLMAVTMNDMRTVAGVDLMVRLPCKALSPWQWLALRVALCSAVFLSRWAVSWSAGELVSSGGQLVRVRGVEGCCCC